MDKIPVDYATCERLRLGSEELTILMSSAQSGAALFAIENRIAAERRNAAIDPALMAALS